MGNKTITYTRKLSHPIEKVWRAITDDSHRAAWFPELTLSLKTGGDAVVNFSGSECPPPETNSSDVYYCTVTRYEPPNILEYSGPGEHHRFELSPQETGCLLKFSATLPDAQTFDDDRQKIQSRYSVACGWHYKLDAMEWSLDGVPFEDEGYAGPIKTEYYFAYRKLDQNK
ncbi:MAG: SRPBCC family protein [bacterium]|nr:hypothetical protein [Gammaproteobacteria bacterium]